MVICTFDPFGYGLGRYTFTESCQEKAGLKLNAGTRKKWYKKQGCPLMSGQNTVIGGQLFYYPRPDVV